MFQQLWSSCFHIVQRNNFARRCAVLISGCAVLRGSIIEDEFSSLTNTTVIGVGVCGVIEKRLGLVVKYKQSGTCRVISLVSYRLHVLLIVVVCAGKEKICKNLYMYHFRCIEVPSRTLLRLRIAFDSLNYELRSAFYALSYYFVAYDMVAVRRYAPVAVNR